jgi:hypothetical protein
MIPPAQLDIKRHNLRVSESAKERFLRNIYGFSRETRPSPPRLEANRGRPHHQRHRGDCVTAARSSVGFSEREEYRQLH